METVEVEIGTDQRRASQGLEDAAATGGLTRHDLLHHRARLRRCGAAIGETAGESADQFPIFIERLDLEASDPTHGLT
ncbi:MAG: hypothetical protein INR65_15055 [Gluconacetobacter diazotrophicus]|nr:hypothetical protein [Gluconacetobacter diazotrophicus]